MRKPRLMTPGPAMVPEDVLLELARPVIHHRSNEAKQVVDRGARRAQGSLPDEERRLDPDGLGHRGDGSGGGQRGAAGRQGPRLERGLLRGAVGQYLQGVRHQRRRRSRPSGASRSIPIRWPRRLRQHPDTVAVSWAP